MNVVVVDEGAGFAVAWIGRVDPRVTVLTGFGGDECFVFIMPVELKSLRCHLLGLSLRGGRDDFADVRDVAQVDKNL